MKKILGITLFLLAFALPAMADVNVLVDVTKDKTILVTETIDIVKVVRVTSTVTAVPAGAAEANAMVNQTTALNFVGPETTGELELDNFHTAVIADSINENIGIVNVNQDTGNMNNQANAIAIAQTDAEAYADAQAAVDQETTFNEEYASRFFDIAVLDKEADLINSMNLNEGIISANQSNGNMNNQANAVALAASVGGVLVALAEADLGQVNTENAVWEFNTNKLDLIATSINGNTGVTNFNQSAGNMNNQASIVSVSVTLPR